ncbi:hypothetical protein [Planosporangium mesophilum]|uniref:Secreted protein n=1 Tax=Planosporangium mesophilum TaxID=689768 RepID=A0A8J3TRE0_9ACTN|nr:hypothetical protein [Planosporangium mesophilum]NJC85965.1 hypothetical protein [Planosporangium mesophilum]GII25935.1 hypothetical protein Pme01_55320 [Planosporangium mesophilum]
MLHRTLKIAATAAVVGATALIPAAAASAAPTTAETFQAQLVVTGIDQQVANRNGYKVIVKDGKLDTVKVANHPITQEPVVTTMDNPVVTGNCGTSFLYYAAQGGRKAQVYTGFDLTTAAPMFAYDWTVAVTDNIGVGSKPWGGPHVGYSWDDTWTTSHGTTGYSWAQVTNGHAYLADGRTCNTLGPWQSTNLY